MSHYQLRLMRENDLDSIRDLFRRVYGTARKTEEDGWRYLRTESGLAPVMLAEENGTLVGSYAVWPVRMVCDGKIIPGAQALDIMVDPSHNGKGLFTMMGEAIFRALASNGIKLLYGFPNPPSYIGHMRKMSWHHVADIPRYVRFVHPFHRFHTLPKWLRKLLHRAADIARPQSHKNIEVTFAKPAPEQIEKIIGGTVFPKYSCHILRDENWFAWRYDVASGLSHQWRSATKDGVLIGFAVFREESLEGNNNKRFIRISELWGDKEAVDALLRQIIRHAYETDCMLVMIVTNLPQLRNMLCRHLFLRLQKKPYIVRPLTAESLPANIHVAENWHIMSGDFDAM